MLPANNEDEAYTECEDDLNRACADLANCAGDTGILLSQLSDNGIYFETKAAYGKDVVTAFIQLNGATVGAVANRSEIYGEDGTVKEKMDGTLSARGAKKAADFVNFCDAFCIPVLTITNVTGFKATKCSERTMAKNAAALTAAFANATVPKVNVSCRQSIRKRIRCHEQQIHRSRHGICMAERRNRNDGCKICSKDHVRRI